MSSGKHGGSPPENPAVSGNLKAIEALHSGDCLRAVTGAKCWEKWWKRDGFHIGFMNFGAWIFFVGIEHDWHMDFTWFHRVSNEWIRIWHGHWRFKCGLSPFVGGKASLLQIFEEDWTNHLDLLKMIWLIFPMGNPPFGESTGNMSYVYIYIYI